MRKSKQETAETRRRIVEAASEAFRRNGIDGTAVADLMSAAGMTHGGFYKHFDSKEQVVEESMALAAEVWRESMEASLGALSPKKCLRTAIGDFLSVEHRDDMSCGCPFVALGSELARSSDAVRQATTDSFEKLVDAIASHIEGMTPAAAKKEALGIVTTVIGALTMARIVTDPELSESILRETRKHLTR